MAIDEKLKIPKIGIEHYSLKIPNFSADDLKSDKYNVQLGKAIKIAKKDKKYIRIKYGDRNGNVTFRTITNFKIELIDKDTYLIGKCLLRNAERNFHFERIQFLEILNLEQLISK